jgi:hypothetical protein
LFAKKKRVLHLRSLATLPPRLLHHRAIKLAIAPAQLTSSCTISHRLLASFPMAKKERDIEKEIWKTRGICSAYWALPLLPF